MLWLYFWETNIWKGQFVKISDAPEIQNILDKVGGDYDPSYDGMTKLEWLVLVKKYLQGNKRAFEPMAGNSS